VPADSDARRLSGQALVVERATAAIRAGDLAEAKRLAREGLAAGGEHPLLLNLRALDHEDHGRLEAALADLRRALLLAPGDYSILNACGLCLARLERMDEAVQCYDRALAIRADFGAAWFNRGWALERLGEIAEAAASLEKAATLNPQNAQAWANLAHLAARRGDADATRRYAEQAFGVQPGHPTAVLALANVELSTPVLAESRLRGLISTQSLSLFDRGMAFSELGDALDAQDRPAEAFEAYSQGNAAFRAEAAPRFAAAKQPTVLDTLQWLIDWAEGLDRTRWTRSDTALHKAGREARHVFLIGFPRSGTTLAESILARHPDVVTLEEKNALYAAVMAFLGDPRSVNRLSTLSDQQLQEFRGDYWARVRGYGVEPADKIFIDKFPLNVTKIALIARLFPAAKIIFAVRDPRDVVFSCFRRRFTLNPSMYEFLDLRRTALFYDHAMRLAEAFRRLQPMDERYLVYERLVEDPESQARALCTFIGAQWRSEMMDFAARARRGDVASASSAQIARGLFGDGAGQWRRYRRELAPVLPILAPWAERFGYPAA
jgi:tetratricopeptide (TPR) repeat protein